MGKPTCPQHLTDLRQVSYARLWKCPHGDYQVDEITVFTHNQMVADYAPNTLEAVEAMEADVRAALKGDSEPGRTPQV